MSYKKYKNINGGIIFNSLKLRIILNQENGLNFFYVVINGQ